MAQIHIPDDLLLHVQQYAQQTGKTQEEVVQEALTDLMANDMPFAVAEPDQLLPPYGSAAEQQLLEAVRNRVGAQLKSQGISIAEEISLDRGA